MKYLFIALLFAGCRATDLQPDEFRVDVGHGDTTGMTGARASDSSTDFGSVGWTWKIGDVEDRRTEERYAEAIAAREPEVIAPPKEKPLPLTTLILGVLSVGATTVGILNKLGKVDWVSPKKGH